MLFQHLVVPGGNDGAVFDDDAAKRTAMPLADAFLSLINGFLHKGIMRMDGCLGSRHVPREKLMPSGKGQEAKRKKNKKRSYGKGMQKFHTVLHGIGVRRLASR